AGSRYRSQRSGGSRMRPSASTAPSTGRRCNITARMAPAAAVLAARAVLRFQIRDDVVRLVHLAARVGIDEIRHLDLAAALLELYSLGAPLRHVTNQMLHVELAQRLSHLAAERRAFHVVECEGLETVARSLRPASGPPRQP